VEKGGVRWTAVESAEGGSERARRRLHESCRARRCLKAMKRCENAVTSGLVPTFARGFKAASW